MDKLLPGAVIPKAVMQELDEIPLLREELKEAKRLLAEEKAERQSAQARLEEWEAKARGALAKEQEMLEGLGWKKNA